MTEATSQTFNQMPGGMGTAGRGAPKVNMDLGQSLRRGDDNKRQQQQPAQAMTGSEAKPQAQQFENRAGERKEGQQDFSGIKSTEAKSGAAQSTGVEGQGLFTGAAER